MGNACSCPGGKADDQGFEVGFDQPEKVIQAPSDLFAAKKEDPLEPINKEAKEEKAADATPPAPQKVVEEAFPPPKGEDRGEEEPWQDRAYREMQEGSAFPAEPAKPGSIARRPSSENVTMEAYTAKHAAKFDKVLALEKPDGWTMKKEVDGVKIYTKEVPGERLLYFKGVTEIKVAGGIPEILSKLFKTENRPKWDELCSHAETPQYQPPLYKYAYVQLNPPMSVISKRDILTIGRFRLERDGAVTVALQSEELDSYPARNGYVRINFIEGGYVIRPKDGKSDHLEITWTGLVDPQGWLPTWVANLAVVKQGIALAKLRAFILEGGK